VRVRSDPPSSSDTDLGFTLIEILIVIVVLGILAAVTVFALNGVTVQSAQAACDADARTVNLAIAAYNAQTGGVPPATSALLTSGANPYLQTFPSSSSYAITIVNGAELVAAPPSATPVPYVGNPSCANVTSSSASTSLGATTTTLAGATTTTTTVPSSTTTASTSTTSTSTSTTTVPAATTTTVGHVANGVTATPSDNMYSGGTYGGQEIVTLTNTYAITAMTITITVALTPGTIAGGQYTSFPGGSVSQSSATSGSSIVFTSVLGAGQTVPAGYTPNGAVGAQFGGNGSAHASSGDTWSVTTTSNGTTSTLTGTFP
jgi:prepilin-type N-terminal cleavage/methylation domain-containing protein